MFWAFFSYTVLFSGKIELFQAENLYKLWSVDQLAKSESAANYPGLFSV
jgi:hypothetical protein